MPFTALEEQLKLYPFSSFFCYICKQNHMMQSISGDEVEHRDPVEYFFEEENGIDKEEEEEEEKKQVNEITDEGELEQKTNEVENEHQIKIEG